MGTNAHIHINAKEKSRPSKCSRIHGKRAPFHTTQPHSLPTTDSASTHPSRRDRPCNRPSTITIPRKWRRSCVVHSPEVICSAFHNAEIRALLVDVGG